MSNPAPLSKVFRIEKLQRRYKHYWLDIPHLEIPCGVVVLLGASGAGKTTLLNILACLDTDYLGDVYFNGEVLPHDVRRADSFRQQSFSFAFQTSNLLANLPASINVDLSRRICGRLARSHHGTNWKDVLQGFFIGDTGAQFEKYVRRYPSELSAGQNQRVSVARALLKAADGATVLFADEPTANVDRWTADNCFNILREWQQSGNRNLLFLATHDLILAKEADYVILLNARGGREDCMCVGVAAYGSKSDCWPTVEDVLLTGPTRNPVSGSLRRDEVGGESKPSAKGIEIKEYRPAHRPKSPKPAPCIKPKGGWSECQSAAENVQAKSNSHSAFGSLHDDEVVIAPKPLAEGVESQEHRPVNCVRNEEAAPHKPAVAMPSSRLRIWSFLLTYCWKDIFRPREWPEIIIRFFVIFVLFLTLAASVTFYDRLPAVADKIITKDRLLRLIEIESTGGFPISLEKMKHLASLRRIGGNIEACPPTEDQQRRLVVGVSPNRQMPLLFYNVDGQLSQRWVDNVRVVYHGHPELQGGEQLFSFWDIPPMMSDMKILTSSTVLTRLGFDPEEFQQRLARHDPTACLYINERGWKIRLDVERIEEFPDQDVELLIPAKLACMVEKLDPRVMVETYGGAGFGLYTSADEAEQEIPEIERGIELFRTRHVSKSAFNCTVRPSGETGHEAHVIWVQSDAPKGLSKGEWTELLSEISRVTRKHYQVEYSRRVLGDGEYVEFIPPLDAHMVTMFVEDYEDIPDILEYLADHRQTLKVCVLTTDNLEFVQTAQRAVSLGTEGVFWVSLMFGSTCLVAIAYSFLAMLHRKLGEIGILRAYGAPRSFVFSRFALEIIGVCVFGAVVASLLFFRLILIWLNELAVETFPSVFGGGVLLAYGRMYRWISLGVIVLVTSVVGFVVWCYVHRSPAALLSMRE